MSQAAGSAETGLRPPEHQVAGHSVREGGIGPLVDGSGLFFKPFQSDGRGQAEVSFYSSLETLVPPDIRGFFPSFYGTRFVPLHNDPDTLHQHLVLEDLLSSFPNPSVLDVKIGSRTWPLDCSEDYFQKCFPKDRNSTSMSLGFRLSGARIRTGDDESSLWRPDRRQVKDFTPNDVRWILRQFVSSKLSDSNLKPDCAFAGAVYGGPKGMLAELRRLKKWFEEQTVFHFCSASVLLGFDRDDFFVENAGASPARLIVKLVDFAHVPPGEGVIDHNFLGGLCSLIKFISDVLTHPDDPEFHEKVLM